jgi:undecaprenyl-diphosphatase
MADVLSGLGLKNSIVHQMKQEIMNAIWMIAVGLLMIFSGLLHKNECFARWDTRIFRIIHIRLCRYAGFFQYIRPLGTGPVSILMILIMYISSWEFGVIATFSYIIAAVIERIIKLSIRRPRPYQILPKVNMGQLPEPHDPSHPSGDSFRVWFLAILFPVAFSLPGPIIVLSFLSATILSIGRIALGVHYPLDVISGTGLGFLFSSIAIFSFQMIIN